MKTLILFAFSIIMLTSCTKQVTTPNEDGRGQTKNYNRPAKAFATIEDSGSFAEGGFGWILRMNDHVFEVPVNLPEDFKINQYRVHVVYQSTDKLVPCKCAEPRYYVEIISIDKASNEPGEEG